MSRRRLAATLVAPAAILVALGAGPLVGVASAAGPTVNLTPAPVGGPPGSYADQQSVNLSVAANTTFTPGATINVLECADPGGSTANLPTDSSTCDGNTIQGPTVIVGSDGSFSLTGYTIYALPSSSLGESSSGQPKCNATNACVLFVGQDQNDFTQPKTFSAPFFVGPTASTPESPLAIALPLGGLGVLAVGTVLVYRRRNGAEAATTR
jgi:hypothetical protein